MIDEDMALNGPQPYTKAEAVADTLERLSATLPNINGTEGVQLILAADAVRGLSDLRERLWDAYGPDPVATFDRWLREGREG